MTQLTGNDDPHVVAAINHAIDLERKGQISAAIEILERLISECPEVAPAHGYLASYLSRTERHDEAINESHKATALTPRSENASLIHYHVLWKAGKYAEAIQEIRRFLGTKHSEEYMKIIRSWKHSVVDVNDVDAVLSEIEQNIRECPLKWDLKRGRCPGPASLDNRSEGAVNPEE